MLTFAPKLEVVDTVNDVAPAAEPDVFWIIASRSKAPVITIAPNGVVAPTAASNSTSELPTANVRLFVSPLWLSTKPVNVICELVVVNVVAVPITIVSDVALP